LLGALFEDDIRAVYLAGGLASYHDVLTNFAVLIPHSASMPGALTAGDLCDLAGSLAPKPLRMEAIVNHLNRAVSIFEQHWALALCVQAYTSNPSALSFSELRPPVRIKHEHEQRNNRRVAAGGQTLNSDAYVQKQFPAPIRLSGIQVESVSGLGRKRALLS
jgi:hypothetical protein